MSELGEWASATLGEEEGNRVTSSERAPELGRFADADEAMAWYNGWLRTLPPPDPPLDPEYGWDPVNRWRDAAGEPFYWYVVGTGAEPSLILEAASVVAGWGNEYYDHYADLHGADAAEALLAEGDVPEVSPPDLPPATPEGEWIVANRGIAV